MEERKFPMEVSEASLADCGSFNCVRVDLRCKT
jgi:hypothetical protein